MDHFRVEKALPGGTQQVCTARGVPAEAREEETVELRDTREWVDIEDIDRR